MSLRVSCAARNVVIPKRACYRKPFGPRNCGRGVRARIPAHPRSARENSVLVCVFVCDLSPYACSPFFFILARTGVRGSLSLSLSLEWECGFSGLAIVCSCASTHTGIECGYCALKLENISRAFAYSSRRLFPEGVCTTVMSLLPRTMYSEVV